ncbi:MAG: ATP-dependent helicase [Oscillospiraceae bacterium]|nr:ATP-dependent helicase [Oscillospiraceae bacterium]
MKGAAGQIEKLLAEKNIRLTGAQKQGLDLSGEPALLLAVPGSGKTTVLTARAAALLLAGVPEGRVLNLTFSRESARDMAERFQKVFPELPAPRFSTIHSLCYSILGDYSRRTGRPVPPLVGAEGQPTALQLVREVMKRRSGEFFEDEDLNDLLAAIGLCKNLMLKKEEMGDVPCLLDNLPELFEGYQAVKAERGLMDYDDILLYALTFLRKIPAMLESWRGRYDWINVDESQDLSKVQLELIRLLKPDGRGLFMVGDEDQSIYGFRGAYPKGILAFEKTFPGGKVHKMEDNFRSRPGILDRCGSFIRLSRDRYDKTLQPGREAAGEPVTVLESKNPEHFCSQVLKKLASVKKGETVGILYRNNLSALPVADLLLEAGVAFSAAASPSLLIRYHIRTLCDLLRMAEDPGNFELFASLKCGFDLDSAARDEVLAKRGTGSVPALLKKAGAERGLEKSEKLGEVLENIRGKTPEEALRLIEKELRFGKFLLAKRLGADDPGSAFRCSVFRQFCRRCGSIPELFARIDRVQKLLNGPVKQEGARVHLTTVHSSKGLEFDHVILIDLCDGILPGRTSLDQLAEKKNAAFYEEVRLFYVAATRAKETLTLCGPAESEKGLIPSRFMRNFMETTPKKPAPKKKPAGKKAALVPGGKVSHPFFGEGTVLAVKGDFVRIDFSGEEKTLSVSYCEAKGLL